MEAAESGVKAIAKYDRLTSDHDSYNPDIDEHFEQNSRISDTENYMQDQNFRMKRTRL